MAVIRAYDTNILSLPDNYSEIIAVDVKTNPASSYYARTQRYDIVGSSLVLNTTYAEIKLTYNTDNAYRTLENRTSKEQVGKKLNDLVTGAAAKSYGAQSNQLMEQYAAQHANVFTSVGQIISGFQALGQPVEENIKGSSQVFPTITTADALKAQKESTETTNSNKITGKSTAGGAPDLVIAGSNPKGLNEVYQGEDAVPGLAGATPNEIKGVLQSTSLVSEQIDARNVSDQVNQIAGEKAAATAAAFLSFIADPQGTFRAVAGQNILPQVLGNISGLNTNGFGNPLPSLDQALPALIDGFGNSNFAANTYATGNLGQYFDQSTNVTSLGGSISTYGTADHSFEVVDTEEEFRDEVGNIRRDITAMMVHWSKTYNNQFLNATDMNEIHRALQETKVGVEETAALGQLAGIMWHYVILKDGTLQRGRPIELELLPEMAWSKHTIHIGFIAGYTQQYTQASHGSYQPTSDSITDAQWKTFDMITKTMTQLKPGIGIFGHSDIHHESTCPGFDVDDYMKDKFGYVSAYTDKDLESGQALTAEELVTRVPYTTATAASELPTGGVDVETLATANTDTTVTSAQINAALTEYSSLLRQIDNNDTQFVFIQNQIATNQYTTVTRTNALDTLFDLKETRKTLDDKLKAHRVLLVNAGYVYDSENETWLKR